jgi:hypothetical protein
VCGLLFVTPVAWSRRRTCGRECETEYHRERGSSEVLRAAARRRGREATAGLRALDRAAFDRLPARTADVVRLYYGLDDTRAWTKRELADRFGLTVWRVQRTRGIRPLRHRPEGGVVTGAPLERPWSVS